MAAIEIPNRVQAMVLFTLANPPVLLRAAGVVGVTRTGAGVYEVELDEPAASPQNAASATLNGNGTAFTVVASVAAPDILVEAFNLAGDPADGGNLCYVEVARFPT